MLTIVRNSLIAVIASLIFLSVPLVFTSTDETVRNIALATVTAAAYVPLITVMWALFTKRPALLCNAVLTSPVMAAALYFAITGDAGLCCGFSGIIAATAALLTWLHVTRDERASERAELRSAREAEQKEQVRLNGIGTALTGVPSVWLLDALGVPENTTVRGLVVTVGDLPEGTEYALARAHRKGVKPDAVASFVAAGAFTEADADLLAGEVA